MKLLLLRVLHGGFTVGVLVRRGLELYRKGREIYKETENIKVFGSVKEEKTKEKISEFNVRARYLWRKKYRAEPFRKTIDDFREDIWKTKFENYLKWKGEKSKK